MSEGHRHLTHELLRAARRGEISQRELAELLRRQLEEICPECKAESLAERAEAVSLAAYHAPRSPGVRRLGGGGVALRG